METTPLTDTVGPSSRLVRRLVGAAATGLLIVFFWGVLAQIAVPIALLPCRAEGSGCLGLGLLVEAVAAVAAVVLAWPMLYLLRVRPAWPVALMAPIAVGGLVWIVSDGLGQGLRFLPLVLSLSYGVAALATDVKVRWPWRVGMVVVVVATYPLAPLLRDHRTDAGLQRDRTVRGTSTGEWVPGDLGVVVRRVPVGFAPPGRCPVSDRDRSVRACQAVTTDTWRIAEDNQGLEAVIYLVRREGVLTTITGSSWQGAPEDVIRRAAETMRSRPPSFFTT